MRAPEFWSKPPGQAARALSPLGTLYGAIAGRRMVARPRGHASVPVICVGNFTVGGAGKTPAAQAIADLLRSPDRTVSFLSRGYGGHLPGPVRVDPATHTAADVGDEPLLLARQGPTVIARDRIAGAALLAHSATVIVMDDGFQNPSLKKDLSLIVVDTDAGLPNRHCIPAGPLRAPLDVQVRHAHGIIAIGDGPVPVDGPPVYRTRVVPDPLVDTLYGRQVLAFAGIGRPQKFFEMLQARGATVAISKPFADHHAYTPADAKHLLSQAERDDLALVTTAKDAVRLAGDPALERLREFTLALDVGLVFEDPDALSQQLEKAISGR